MIDHLGFPVSNFVRSKAFYEKALAPLSYVLVMEVSADNTEGNAPAAGFGIWQKPDVGARLVPRALGRGRRNLWN